MQQSGAFGKKSHSGQKNQPHQRKQLVTFVNAEQEMRVYTVYTCNAGGAKPIYVTVEFYGKPVVMQLDAGSARSLIPESLYQEHLVR